MLHKLLAVIAWASLAFIAYATLSPIQARPKISSADLEHIVAFAVTGVSTDNLNAGVVVMKSAQHGA
jgi:GTPase